MIFVSVYIRIYLSNLQRSKDTEKLLKVTQLINEITFTVTESH